VKKSREKKEIREGKGRGRRAHQGKHGPPLGTAVWAKCETFVDAKKKGEKTRCTRGKN